MSENETMVRYSTEGRVATIVLDRPDRRNAINGPMVQQLRDAVMTTRADSQVILLRSSSKHFCAGFDLDAFGQKPAPDWVSRFPADWATLHRELWDDGRPIVIEHRGAAIAGAAALLFSGDVIVSSDDAWASVPELAKGVPAPVNTAWLLARHGVAVTNEVVLLGQRLDSASLRRLGISAATVSEDELTERAHSIAAQLAGYVPAALNSTMRAIRECQGRGFPEILDEIQAYTGKFDPPRRPSTD